MKNLKRYFLFGCLKFCEVIFNLFPYDLGFAAAGGLGALAYHAAGRERKRALENLSSAFGAQKTSGEIKRIAKEVFKNFGRSLFELFVVRKIMAHWDRFVEIEGLEHLDKALAAKKGVVVIAAHMDNWELLAGCLAGRGYTCSVVARRVYFHKYNDWMVALRKKMKVETIYRDAPVREVVSALRENRLVGFVADQDTDGIDGVFVDFFGKPAWTPTSPVRFARISEAPMLPVFITREGKRHKITVRPALTFIETKDKEADLKSNTQQWVALQEAFIRENPSQWVWNHRRWKTQ